LFAGRWWADIDSVPSTNLNGVLRIYPATHNHSYVGLEAFGNIAYLLLIWKM